MSKTITARIDAPFEEVLRINKEFITDPLYPDVGTGRSGPR